MHRRSFVSRRAASEPRSADQFDGPAVFVAPWVGPNDEIVLIARDSRRRIVGEPYAVPRGADHIAASDAMWDRVIRAERKARLI